MSDLKQLPVEELAGMPGWLIPLSRKAEVDAFLARKRRGVTKKTAEEEELEAEAARQRAKLPCDGQMPNWVSGASPATKNGPRGGRYTEDVTKDGRPYRRYF